MDGGLRSGSYSWHQSHSEATVLILVPWETDDDDVSVSIQRDLLLAGVAGKLSVKGRLYGSVDHIQSRWQLEPRTVRRPRYQSTTSTASSYALVDTDISSSFDASLQDPDSSDFETSSVDHDPSPAFTSPPPSPVAGPSLMRFERPEFRSMVSSSSSLESALQPSFSNRLLTVYLVKENSSIWPTLISAAAPSTSAHKEQDLFNLDSTSMLIIGTDLFDLRHDKEQAFEYFVRAWLEAHHPSAVLKLVTHYITVNTELNVETEYEEVGQPAQGSQRYIIQKLGGSQGVARLFVEAGLLHLEGAASSALSPSYSTLSSIRMPPDVQGSTEVWKRDREVAGQYFDAARRLQSDLDVPILPGGGGPEYQMPSIDIYTEKGGWKEEESPFPRKKARNETEDEGWLLYLPAGAAAGTALLFVGVLGAMGLSHWRKNQS